MSFFLSYIGPGAGIAAAGTLLVTVIAVATMLANFAFWPIRRVWRWIRLPKKGKAQVRRVIVMGLDGMDPRRVERLMKDGVMPSFSKLAEQGGFYRLGSTVPPISPVAWSSFLTGTNPGKHGIFDFVARDPRTYLPKLSSAEVSQRPSRFGTRVNVKGLRKSEPFWKHLGKYGVSSTVLRVPITFPAEPFDGSILSAMCIPDLRGTQSSYTFFSTEVEEEDDSHSGGLWAPLEREDSGWKGILPGPEESSAKDRSRLEANVEIRDAADGRYAIKVGSEEVDVSAGELSPWVRVSFPIGKWRKMHGLVRVQLQRDGEKVTLYVTPIQIDPARPVLPIGFPWIFSNYLSRLIGPYATLGLAEDTSALNDGVIDDATFLKQAEDIHKEREEMALELMNHRTKGMFACVFDGPDRIQHMFFREEETPEGVSKEGESTTIDRMYQDLDSLVGKTIQKVRRDDLLLVISDHGFTSFRRGVDLNCLLEQEGLLHWKSESTGRGAYGDIDWTRTKAYAFGLSGIYFNLKGREAGGILEKNEVSDLANKITALLMDLRDPESGDPAVSKVYPSAEAYRGPYSNEGPDLVVGYHEGYRVSWDCASGYRSDSIFSENDKCWSGDHCVDRNLVPGMMFASRPLESINGRGFQLVDLAPSILRWFGVEPPGNMDGEAIRFSTSNPTG